MRNQCQLLQLNRSSLYYQARPQTAKNRELMRLIDEEYTRHPIKGVGQMLSWLRRDRGKICNHKRVRRLMRKMGLEAIHPKPNTSRANKEHKIYPYLLNGVIANLPNHIWSIDITYIRLEHGFAYLVAIIDWHSRAVLSWRLSNTLSADFCCEALEEAIAEHGCPDIFNSDQGSQFTGESFINILVENKISISMDGRGRAFDNIFVERLWRTVKYEDVYVHGYQTMREAKQGLSHYFKYYNYERFHSSLDDRTPWEYYSGKPYRMAA